MQIKPVVSLFLVLAVSTVLASASFATKDNGPADITLATKAAKKPSLFPHAKHQESISCGDCHHLMVDRKQVPLKEGAEIAKCQSCHNSDVLGGVKVTIAGLKKPLKLDTFKGAGHGNCLACHKSMAAKDSDLKDRKIDKCSACHPKKK